MSEGEVGRGQLEVGGGRASEIAEGQVWIRVGG